MRSVENNVWPTLQSAAVRNDNTSIITLIFTGRGIVLGTGSNDAFVVTLEDCRLCSLNWHEPKKIIIHPTHVERIEGKYSKANALPQNVVCNYR
jgi:hexokinase